MEKVRTMVLGLGGFGHSWADNVAPTCEGAQLVAVVDKNEATWQGIPEGIPKFTDLDTALDAIKPELVVNATPPSLHTELNEKLLRRGVAVLCEKPIADRCERAQYVGKVLQETGGFLMIGQNYRYQPVMRKAKELLDSGVLGGIHSISCYFRRCHDDRSKTYHGALKHPLIADVTIHHLDLVRYLTGLEPVRVWCQEYDAKHSWYDYRLATAHILTEMTGNAVFHYDGTLAASLSTTDWNGEWELQGDNGILQIQGNCIVLRKEDCTEKIRVDAPPIDSRVYMLQDACEAIRQQRKGETDYADSFYSYQWMEKTIEASETKQWISIK